MDTLAKMSLVEPEDMKQWIAIRQNRDDSESESDGFFKLRPDYASGKGILKFHRHLAPFADSGRGRFSARPFKCPIV
jgi:hypothetical protein